MKEYVQKDVIQNVTVTHLGGLPRRMKFVYDRLNKRISLKHVCSFSPTRYYGMVQWVSFVDEVTSFRTTQKHFLKTINNLKHFKEDLLRSVYWLIGRLVG
jgi:hypothetical protein